MTTVRGPRNETAAFVGLVLASSTTVFDAFAVNVALPEIGRDLGGGVAGLQWVSNGYTLVFASLLLTAGAIGDRLGSRRVFLVGVALLGVASPLCGLAPSIELLVAARALEGLGAALLIPSSLALLTALYPEPRRRSRAVTYWMGTTSLASLVATPIGGVLVDAVSWRSAFLVNGIVAVVVVVLVARHVAPSAARSRHAVDGLGQLLGIVALASTTFALTEGRRIGWGDPLILVGFATGVCAAAMFVIVERRVAEPMLSLDLFRSRSFSVATSAAFLYQFAFYGVLFALTIWFQRVLGYSALRTGFALVPLSMTGLLATFVSWRLTARAGPRRTITVGFVTAAAGAGVLATLDVASPYLLAAAGLVVLGFGATVAMPAVVAAAAVNVPDRHAGVASAVVNAGRQTGGVLGVACLGTLLAGTDVHGGVVTVLLVAVGAFLVAAGLARRWMEPLPTAAPTDLARPPAVARARGMRSGGEQP